MARIYVGTYAKYNAGNLSGQWLDCEDYADKDAFLAACAELHADESDPELMFQDHEEIPAGMIGESFVSDDLWDWLDLDADDRELLSVYRENVDQSGDIDAARDAFRGKANSAEDWAEDYLDEMGMLGELHGLIRCHIDWSGVVRDLSCDGLTFVNHGGEVWVFGG